MRKIVVNTAFGRGRCPRKHVLNEKWCSAHKTITFTIKIFMFDLNNIVTY